MSGILFFIFASCHPLILHLNINAVLKYKCSTHEDGLMSQISIVNGLTLSSCDVPKLAWCLRSIFFIWSDTPYGFSWRWVDARAVASLTVPGGQKFHFPHFFLKSRLSFLIFPQTFTHTLRHWLMPLRQYLINVLTPPTCYIWLDVPPWYLL